MNTQFFTTIKRFILLLTLSFVAFFFSRVSVPSFAQDSEVREIENKIPEHLLIKIKFKKETEEKIKDLKNDQWVRDFELEVTNTSDKPIYYLDFFVVIPGVISESGAPIGMPLRYGRMAFIKSSTRPLPDDEPIKPGETFSFKIPEKYQKGWYGHKTKGYMNDPRRIQLVFVHLSFGDGTGFRGTTAVPYPPAVSEELHDLQKAREEPPSANRNKSVV
jgi:hypothetical protein